jgi:hypothetical protein
LASSKSATIFLFRWLAAATASLIFLSVSDLVYASIGLIQEKEPSSFLVKNAPISASLKPFKLKLPDSSYSNCLGSTVIEVDPSLPVMALKVLSG